jgi:hypothetical protein
VFFIDWQKKCDHVNWARLTKILKLTGIEWRERRLIRTMCMDQCIKLKLDQRETRKVKTGGGVRQGCCLSPILFNLYSEYLTMEALEGFGDFKIGGQIIRTVKYEYYLALQAKEEAVLQGMTERQIEIGRCCGMQKNVEKN